MITGTGVEGNPEGKIELVHRLRLKLNKLYCKLLYYIFSVLFLAKIVLNIYIVYLRYFTEEMFTASKSNLIELRLTHIVKQNNWVKLPYVETYYLVLVKFM
jgi:hypothetical protein